MYFLSFSDWVNEQTKPLQDFVVANHGNPFLWITLFFGGLAAFLMLYEYLNKHDH